MKKLSPFSNEQETSAKILSNSSRKAAAHRYASQKAASTEQAFTVANTVLTISFLALGAWFGTASDSTITPVIHAAEDYEAIALKLEQTALESPDHAVLTDLRKRIVSLERSAPPLASGTLRHALVRRFAPEVEAARLRSLDIHDGRYSTTLQGPDTPAASAKPAAPMLVITPTAEGGTPAVWTRARGQQGSA